MKKPDLKIVLLTLTAVSSEFSQMVDTYEDMSALDVDNHYQLYVKIASRIERLKMALDDMSVLAEAARRSAQLSLFGNDPPPPSGEGDSQQLF